MGSVDLALNMRTTLIIIVYLLGLQDASPLPQNNRRRFGQRRARNRLRQRGNRFGNEEANKGLYGVSRDSLEWEDDNLLALPAYKEEAIYESLKEEENVVSNLGKSENSEIKELDNDKDACGPECRNLLHEVDHPKEQDRCPQGMVLDIYGYCRYEFQEERRDWSWWESLRQYVYSYNSWANSYHPTIHQQMYHMG